MTNHEEPAPDAVWNSALLASLFDRMSDAVIVADVRGRFVAVNAAARRISQRGVERFRRSRHC